MYNTKSSRSVRIFWCIVLCTCIGFCLYQLTDRIQAYFKHTTTLDVLVRRNQTIRFPALTICPSEKDSIPKFHEIIKRKLCENSTEKPSCEKKFDPEGNYIYRELNTTENEVDDYSFVIRKDIVNATIPNGSFGTNEALLPFDANYTYVRTFWGKCLVITPNTEIEYRGPYTFVQFRIISNGAMFFLHSEGVEQRHEAYYLAESLNERRFSNIRLGTKQYNFLNTDKYPCLPEKDVASCRNECMDRKLDKILNCSVPFLAYSKLRPCESTMETFSAYNEIQDFYATLKSGDCNCYRTCGETLFSITTDVVDSLDVNETHFKLYYPDNLHEIINESYSYSFSALLSDIGGSLGFYLGICVVTFVEVVDNFLRQCLRHFNLAQKKTHRYLIQLLPT